MKNRIDIDINEIKMLYESGLSIRSISKVFGVSYNAIYNRIKKSDIKIRTNRIDIDLDEIVRLYKDGVSIINIGKRFGVSDDLIRKRLL